MTTMLRSSGAMLKAGKSSGVVYAILAVSLQTLSAQVTVSDDFNDGNDSGWQRYNALAPLGLNATYSFPNGGYRIQTTYTTGVRENPGRSGTVRPEIYTDFYTTVDLVNWNDSLPQSVGLLARVGTPGLQATTGYAFTWDRGNPTSQTAGDVDISRLTGEVPTGVTVNGSDVIHFQTGHSYRLVFIGRGSNLEGRVYDLSDTTTPVVVVQGVDTMYPSGMNGLVVFDNSGGQNQTDATFDNFFATDVEPPRLQFTHNTFFEFDLSWPEVPAGWVLQSSTVLPGTITDWTDVDSAEIRLMGGVYIYSTLTHPAFGGQPRRFYRLVRR